MFSHDLIQSFGLLKKFLIIIPLHVREVGYNAHLVKIRAWQLLCTCKNSFPDSLLSEGYFNLHLQILISEEITTVTVIKLALTLRKSA